MELKDVSTDSEKKKSVVLEAVKKTSQISNDNIEKTIKVLPSWIPILPGYLKFKKREGDALFTMAFGYDTSKNEEVTGGLRGRVERAVALETEALLAGAGATIDVLSAVATLGGGKATGETAKVVVGKVSKGKGAEVIVESAGKVFTKLADTVKDETAKKVIGETGRIWNSLAENQAAKAIAIRVINKSGVLKPIEKEASEVGGRQKVLEEIFKGAEKINSGIRKESNNG